MILVILFAPLKDSGQALHLTRSFIMNNTKQMITDDFKALPDHEQDMIIFDKGKFVDAVVEGNSIFVLYCNNTFFVEWKYDTVTYSISSKKAFICERRLNKYLNLK